MRGRMLVGGTRHCARMLLVMVAVAGGGGGARCCVLAATGTSLGRVMVSCGVWQCTMYGRWLVAGGLLLIKNGCLFVLAGSQLGIRFVSSSSLYWVVS